MLACRQVGQAFQSLARLMCKEYCWLEGTGTEIPHLSLIGMDATGWLTPRRIKPSVKLTWHKEAIERKE